MIFKSFRNFLYKKKELDNVFKFYNNIVMLARYPDLYRKGGIPDTLDGRFELVVLHIHLFIKKLMTLGPYEKNFAQNLLDYMIKDFDLSLREIGVGDLSVGKKIKHMVSSYYGRAKVYETTMYGLNEDFKLALKNNLYGTVNPKNEQINFMIIYISSLNNLINSFQGSKLHNCFDNCDFIEELWKK